MPKFHCKKCEDAGWFYAPMKEAPQICICPAGQRAGERLKDPASFWIIVGMLAGACCSGIGYGVYQFALAAPL